MPPSLGAGPRPLEQRHRSIRRGGSEVALKQVARDRKFVTAVGRAHPSWPCHDGEHRARPSTARYDRGLLTPGTEPSVRQWRRATIGSLGFAIDPLDVFNEGKDWRPIASSSSGTPCIIAGRRDGEHIAQDRHRIVGAAIFNEAKSYVHVPAKIAIDVFEMSRSMRNRSFSRCKRVIFAA